MSVDFDSGGLPKNENPKVRVDFRRTEKGEPLRFIRVDFCLSKERKKLKIQSVSSKEWKKPRFFSGLPKNNGKPRFVSGSLEKVEPRFVWCLEWILIYRKNQRFFWWVSKRSRFVSIYEYMNNVIVEL
ncbi:hypothetical protein GLOIN_2v1779851 [Rhizophagus irregularis DAOM 181602=DAOM 197198]|nr:hypothetical protein GLOIN_2v1779851 [Rhizophagus irregularis DAOM 181602=DAOM 197198]